LRDGTRKIGKKNCCTFENANEQQRLTLIIAPNRFSEFLHTITDVVLGQQELHSIFVDHFAVQIMPPAPEVAHGRLPGCRIYLDCGLFAGNPAAKAVKRFPNDSLPAHWQF
jgi:hypothetical protein